MAIVNFKRVSLKNASSSESLSRQVSNHPPLLLKLSPSVKPLPVHTRKISIPDCVEFEVNTYACRGYCESWAIPSALNTLKVNPNQVITSVGQCCNMMDTEDVSVPCFLATYVFLVTVSKRF